MFYFNKEGVPISPFHDIPLIADKEKGHYHMFVEIPRGSNAKLEVSTGDEFNPIKQDVKRGKLRFVHDVEPYSGYIWNYGAFPQTWEDPTHKDERTGCLGDNDPLDVCEIGGATAKVGEVKVVKLLGVLALIDEGETDWKVIVIDVNDPLADKLNDIGDVEKHLPGLSKATYEWFRTYKMPGGAPANEFAFNGEIKDAKYAAQVVEDNYKFWEALHTGDKPPKSDSYDIALANSQLASLNSALGKFTVDAAKAKAAVTLGNDQGHPTAQYSDTITSRELVCNAIQQSQINKPHATTDIAYVVSDIAKGAQKGGDRTQAVVAALQAGKSVSAVNGNKVNEERQYSVYYDGGKNVFGVYEPQSSHGLTSPLSEQVAAQKLDQVGAGYVVDQGDTATLVFKAGGGDQVFTSVGGAPFEPSDDAAPAAPSASDSDDLLSVRAPLALLSVL